MIDRRGCRALRRIAIAAGWAIAATLATPSAGALAAQAGTPPMAPMANSAGPSNPQAMTSMTGVPLPFGIMIGGRGRWMVGYQYMVETLGGLLDGTRRLSESDVLAQFQTTPTDMTMQTHMGMVMYAPTDRFTMMAVLPYVTMSMGELHRDGTRTREQSNGIGDLELRGLYSLFATTDHRHRILANVGIGLPTGSINHPDAEGLRLEYPMQTGSGTFSLLPGLTYLGQVSGWGWGAAIISTVRLGSNAYGYRFGNRYEPQAWIARQLTHWMSVSAGVDGEAWENISGSDTQLDPADEPTKDANRQAGKRLNAVGSVNVHPRHGPFMGQQFFVQTDFPMVQSVDGPQLKRNQMLHVGWQWEF